MEVFKWLFDKVKWLWKKLTGEKQKTVDSSLKMTQSGGQTNIAYVTQITNQNFYQVRDVVPEAINQVLDKHGLRVEKAGQYIKLISNSASPSELIHNLGAFSGSVSTSANIPYLAVARDVGNAIEAMSWQCPHCGNYNWTSSTQTCAKCKKTH